MIKEFWTWFAQNERNIRQALSHHDETPGNVIEHLFAKLECFSLPITCEVRKCPSPKKYCLTISAWGNPDAYILVSSVIAQFLWGEKYITHCVNNIQFSFQDNYQYHFMI